MVEQHLAVGHQHRYHTGVVGMADDGDQLLGAAGAPVGVDDVAAGDLQASPRSDQPPVGVDLGSHLRQRRQGDPIGIGRQVAMGAAERAKRRPQGVAAVDVMPAHHLPIDLELGGELLPAGLQERPLLG